MRRFWLFRSDLTALEYYHKYKDLKTFKENCHDYYMLLPLWLLENNYVNEVIVWRLRDKIHDDIIFDVNGKKYIQKWVRNFTQTLKYPSPDISFWRGGFQKYDMITKMHPKHFGKKLYLGAGRRILPQWGGIYDAFLMEDERDFKKSNKFLPFYKTASPSIFHPINNSEIKWDVCWPCNFTQIRYKGQDFFMNLVSRSKYLKSLRIIHCGNKPEVGLKKAKKLGIKNVEFLGWKSRPELNEILNQSKVALNLSNMQDGCPRISTEILMSGTPLILRHSVRLLRYFRYFCRNVSDENVEKKIRYMVENYQTEKDKLLKVINNELSFENINKKNINLWQKI
ncbi:MAG: glycosyltransferase [Candidatus Thorarchaeota archaeon]